MPGSSIEVEPSMLVLCDFPASRQPFFLHLHLVVEILLEFLLLDLFLDVEVKIIGQFVQQRESCQEKQEEHIGRDETHLEEEHSL